MKPQILDRFDHAVDRIGSALSGRQQPANRAVWPDRFAGIYLGWGNGGPVFGGPEHAALIIGPPRSGKTTSIVIPALALWPGPAIVTSTKTDVLTTTAWRRAHNGQLWHWDPSGTTPTPEHIRPLHWSPITGCENWDTSVARAWALSHAARPNPTGDNAHWTERAQALLAPLLHAAAASHQTMTGLLTWLHRRDPLQAYAILQNGPTRLAENLLAGIIATDHREQSGIWSTADSILAAYRTTTTLTAADQPNFSPDDFAASNDTVYITAPAASHAQHAPLICALLDQLRTATIRRPTPWPPMLWALDELANIAPLPDLPNIVADAGSQGLIILACLQDLSQARHQWGPAADGLLTLFPTTTILPGVADTTTLKTISTLAGQIDLRHQSHTRQGILNHSHTTTSRKEPLLPENIIAHGQPRRALHLQHTHPTWLTLTPWHTTPQIARHLGANPESRNQ